MKRNKIIEKVERHNAASKHVSQPGAPGKDKVDIISNDKSGGGGDAVFCLLGPKAILGHMKSFLVRESA